MVLELRLIAIAGNFLFCLVHIAGTRMIDIGIDALSRGELPAGALAKATTEHTIPLHLHPLERSTDLTGWLSSWLTEFALAYPNNWYYQAQEAGNYNANAHTQDTWVWSLPPAAGMFALEKLGNEWLKRHDTLRGILLIPCLLCPEWFCCFCQSIDLFIFVPAGAISAWPLSMYKPLTVGIYLPLLHLVPGIGSGSSFWYLSVSRFQQRTRRVTHQQAGSLAFVRISGCLFLGCRNDGVLGVGLAMPPFLATIS
jgi:hypothetical protein